MVESPDFLARPVGRGSGVRRLNRRPLIIAGMIICLLLAAVSYTYQMRLAALRRKDAERQEHPEPVGVPAILKDAPESGLIVPRQPPLSDPSAAPPPC
jgi:type IV secretion system protein TrbI